MRNSNESEAVSSRPNRSQRGQGQLPLHGTLNFNNFLNSPESMLDMLLDGLMHFWIYICSLATFVMQELGGYVVFEIIANWSLRNPQLAICILAAGSVIILPIIIIFGFGITTMVVTFTGILMVEGTLLTMVSMLFFGCLGFLAIVLAMLAVVLVATYFGFTHVYMACARATQFGQTSPNAKFAYVQQWNNTKQT